MKKTLLSIIAIAGISLGASAQWEMYVEGGTTDYAGGGTFSFLAQGEQDHAHEIHIENHTGGTVDAVLTRTRINRPTSWVDYACWGHETDPFGGTCYSSAIMDTDPWETPQAVTIADGESGLLASHITPSFTDPATVTYRYYIGTAQDPMQDSMDVEVVMTPLNIEEAAPQLTVSIAPNPADNYINVKADGVESASIKMYDVLGNVILNNTISGSKTINVSEFRNGIYFVIIEAKGAKTINRKVVVRH